MDVYDECRARLLAMGYSESDVDDVLARMRREEEDRERGEAHHDSHCGKSPRDEDSNSTE
jgi:hypothetical protein